MSRKELSSEKLNEVVGGAMSHICLPGAEYGTMTWTVNGKSTTYKYDPKYVKNIDELVKDLSRSEEDRFSEMQQYFIG